MTTGVGGGKGGGAWKLAELDLGILSLGVEMIGSNGLSVALDMLLP